VTSRGIATRYRGVTFRSRLEARYAFVFDAFGWRWCYEPIDCAGYIPDFAVLGDAPLLVEVKPVVTFSELGDHAGRVESCGTGEDGWAHDFLVMGATPLLDARATAGLLGEFFADPDCEHCSDGWEFGRALWDTCRACGAAAVYHEASSFRCRPCGHYDGAQCLTGKVPDLEAVWAAATNATRWTAA
jgi:hypothetical protein